MSALWGVIIGGILTITGQGVAELIRARVTNQGREENRDRSRRKFRIDALELMEHSALRLHDVLTRYQATDSPNPALETEFLEAVSRFDAAVPRVHSSEVRLKMRLWKDTAISWANDDQVAEAELKAWQSALEACGERMRAEQ